MKLSSATKVIHVEVGVLLAFIRGFKHDSVAMNSSNNSAIVGGGQGGSGLEGSASSASSRTLGTAAKEQKKIEQIVLETLFRLVETVLENRLPQEDLNLLDPSSHDGTAASGSTYAKLQLRLLSLEGLRNAMKDWKDDIYKPLQLEIWGMKRTPSSSSEDTTDANTESNKVCETSYGKYVTTVAYG